MTRTLCALLLSLLFFQLPCNSETREIKVGLTLPLSGRLAYVGEDIRHGVDLAIGEFTGSTLRFQTVYEDNQHTAKLAVSTVQKLLHRDKVDLLISLWDMADPIAPLAERAKVPHLAIRWNPHIAEKYSYTLTMESTYRSYIDQIVALLKVIQVSSVGILTEEGQGWILASDYLKEVAPKHAITVVGDERYTNETSDHRTVAFKLMKRKPEMVVLLSNPPHTEILTKRIREINPKQKITGYFEYTESPELFEGIPFASQFAPAAWFESKFQKRFGKPFKARAPQAYDIIKLIAHVQNRSDRTLLGQDLIAALSQIEGIPGASGMLRVSDRRTIESDCVWKTFQSGKLRVVNESEVKKLVHG